MPPVRAPSGGNIFSDIGRAGAGFIEGSIERRKEREEKARQAALVGREDRRLDILAATQQATEARNEALQEQNRLGRVAAENQQIIDNVNTQTGFDIDRDRIAAVTAGQGQSTTDINRARDRAAGNFNSVLNEMLRSPNFAGSVVDEEGNVTLPMMGELDIDDFVARGVQEAQQNRSILSFGELDSLFRSITTKAKEDQQGANLADAVFAGEIRPKRRAGDKPSGPPGVTPPPNLAEDVLKGSGLERAEKMREAEEIRQDLEALNEQLHTQRDKEAELQEFLVLPFNATDISRDAMSSSNTLQLRLVRDSIRTLMDLIQKKEDEQGKQRKTISVLDTFLFNAIGDPQAVRDSVTAERR